MTKYKQELRQVYEYSFNAYNPEWVNFNLLDEFLRPIFQNKIFKCPATSIAASKHPPPSQSGVHSPPDGQTPKKKKKQNPSSAATPESAHARFGKYIANTLDSFAVDDATAAVREIQAVITKYIMKI